MSPRKTEGIILKKYLLRETSYILVVFTRELGKIKGVIKGIRKPYPQFAGDFEIFTRVELLFYEGKKRPLGLITRCEALDTFMPVRKDIERLTYANYYIELIEIVTADNDPDTELFDLLCDGLKMLASGASAKRVTRIFEIKLLSFLGISPQIGECVKCGKKDLPDNKFDIKSGGMICNECALDKGGLFNISKGTQNFIKKIQQSDIKKTCMVKVSREVGAEVEILLKGFMRYYIGRPIKSLRFLTLMEKSGIV
jgi:DNA repair protein RecO (recombination protein O)